MPDDYPPLLPGKGIDSIIWKALVEFSGDPDYVGSGIKKDVSNFVLGVRVDHNAPIDGGSCRLRQLGAAPQPVEARLVRRPARVLDRTLRSGPHPSRRPPDSLLPILVRVYL